MTAHKGWIEVFHNGQFGTWDVYAWCEHHDCGVCLGQFDDRQRAISFAEVEAKSSSRTMIEGVTQ